MDTTTGFPDGFSTSQNDAGRYLITSNNPTGQRASTWGAGWINGVELVMPGQYNNIDPTPINFNPPEIYIPTPTSNSTSSLEDTPVDYFVDNNGQVKFTDELHQGFKDVSGEFISNLKSGIASYAIKKTAIATLGVLFPEAGWLATVKNSWDLYSDLKPLINVGFSQFLHQVGLSANNPSDADYFNAYLNTYTNVCVRLGGLSGGVITGSDYQILTKAGIKTLGAFMFKETDSFTFTIFEGVGVTSFGAEIEGGEKRDFISGTLFNDLMQGNGGRDKLLGNAGVDTLNGGLGIDTLMGGDGSDIYYVDNAGDVVTESNVTTSTGGTDLVNSYLAAYTLGANIENGRILNTGTANITGNTLANSLYASDPHAEYMIAPRVSALAEVVWSPKRRQDWTSFQARMQDQYTRYQAAGFNYRQPKDGDPK